MILRFGLLLVTITALACMSELQIKDKSVDRFTEFIQKEKVMQDIQNKEMSSPKTVISSIAFLQSMNAIN
jgi:uncharacterized protein YxeA